MWAKLKEMSFLFKFENGHPSLPLLPYFHPNKRQRTHNISSFYHCRTKTWVDTAKSFGQFDQTPFRNAICIALHRFQEISLATRGSERSKVQGLEISGHRSKVVERFGWTWNLTDPFMYGTLSRTEFPSNLGTSIDFSVSSHVSIVTTTFESRSWPVLLPWQSWNDTKKWKIKFEKLCF